MNGHPDPLLDALRDANPVPRAATEGARASAEAEALLRDVLAGVRPLRRAPRGAPPRRRRVVVVAIAAAVLLAVALTVAFFVARRADPDPTSFACYGEARVGSPAVVVGAGPDPRATCAELWRAGALGDGPVPSFATCVLPGGGLGLFPGETATTCRELGLAESTLEDPADDPVGAFAAAASARLDARCVDERSARRIVRSELARHGLDDWAVVTDPQGFPAERPCASLGVDAATRTVHVVPVADHRPGTTRPR